MKKFISIVLVFCLLSGIGSALAISEGEARTVIGADLTEDQIGQVYDSFGIERGSVTELNVTNSEERKYLEGLVDDGIIGTKSISCVYIEVLPQDSGLDISTSNITWCSDAMYVNALITAGITDAKVIVAAPLSVSGTAALTGIFKAYEDITGETLDEVAKLVGTQELVITSELADQISSYDAASIVNDLKLILDETVNMTDEELKTQIVEIADEYNVTLSDGQIEQLIKLCRSLEGLSPEELQKKVEDAQATIKKLAAAKEKLGAFTETVSNVFNSVKDAVASIGDFFKNLVSRFKS
jgi:uncharacterized protein YpuA (DUF1002 family)